MTLITFLAILASILLNAVKADVQTHRIEDPDGGKDWIVEVRGDTVVAQYREGDVPIRTRANAKPRPWPKGIVPYVISNDYNDNEKKVIKDALDHISRQTSNCVQFVQRRQEKDYVNIVKKEGCYSYEGITGGAQILSLGNGCVIKRVVIHEATHALGFSHEQSRTDRDKYVEILWNNIKPEGKDAFKIENTNNELGHFDFFSIMTYSPKAFSSNGQNVMKPRDPKQKLAEDMQKLEESKEDIRRIRQLYRCK